MDKLRRFGFCPDKEYTCSLGKINKCPKAVLSNCNQQIVISLILCKLLLRQIKDIVNLDDRKYLKHLNLIEKLRIMKSLEKYLNPNI